MLPNSVDSEKLFEKVVNVLVKENYINQTRTNSLLLTVEWQSVPSALHKQELVIRLTDGNDPFFLYTLNLNEDDFQSLKSQQGLLVDFLSLPQKFIELLELCIEEQRKPHPRFLLTANIQERLGSGVCPAELNIIETNPFKHLTHLSLKLVPASDSVVKKYLAVSLKKLKDENEQLGNKLQFVESDLRSQLQSCQETLKCKNQELELVQRELNAELSNKDSRHSEELHKERERLLKIQREEEEKWDSERREKDQAHRKHTQQLEARVSCLDSLNKELQEKHYKSDTNARELRTRLLSLEEELKQAHQRISTYSKDNNVLETEISEKRQSINRLKSQVSRLDQDITDKDQQITRLQEQIEVLKVKLQKAEMDLSEKRSLVEKRERALRCLNDDMSKGNDIIRKLQQEMHTCHDKIKMRGKIVSKQEQVISEKEHKIEALQEELSTLRSVVKESEDKNKQLTESVKSLESKVEDYEKQMKTNENVIKWLNKQLNETQGAQLKTSGVDPVSSAHFKHPAFGTAALSQSTAANIPSTSYGSSFAPGTKTGSTSTPFLVGGRSLRHSPSPFNMGSSALGASILPVTKSPIGSSGLDPRYLQRNIDTSNASHIVPKTVPIPVTTTGAMHNFSSKSAPSVASPVPNTTVSGLHKPHGVSSAIDHNSNVEQTDTPTPYSAVPSL